MSTTYDRNSYTGTSNIKNIFELCCKYSLAYSEHYSLLASRNTGVEEGYAARQRFGAANAISSAQFFGEGTVWRVRPISYNNVLIFNNRTINVQFF